MKRMWIGLALLVTVLAIGTVLTVTFDRLHRPLAEKLDAAAAAAMTEDWEMAEKLTKDAKRDWEKCRDFTAAVADHEPLEEIDSLFSQLTVLAALQEQDEFAAACAQLARLAEAMADSQRLTWWSLL